MILLSCLIVCASLTMAQTAQYRLLNITISGTPPVNRIALQCREEGAPESDRSAIFWVNGIALSHFTKVERYGDGIVFTITRRLEGRYTCGRDSGTGRMESDAIAFVAYPVVLNVPLTVLTSAASGSTARIECGVKPGNLTNLYIVEWMNATNDEVLIDRQFGNQVVDSVDDRHSIDPNDFSLLINDVTPAEADTYRCVLAVQGPVRANGVIEYGETRHVNLTLRVFDPPMIIEPPTQQIISLSSNTYEATGDNVTYTCTATAAESFASGLEVRWRHGDLERDISNSESYHIKPFILSPQDGLVRVRYQLTIISPMVSDSGTVMCMARLPPSAETGREVTTVTANTTLSVLGRFDSMDVSITQERHVFYSIALIEEIPTDVTLRLEYTRADNPSVTETNTISDGCVNTKNILYIDRAIPFTDGGFTVRVALVSGINSNVVGPFSNRSQVLDVTRLQLSTGQAVGIAAAGAAVLITLVIAIAMVVIVVLIKKYFRVKEDKKIAVRQAELATDKDMAGNPGANRSDVFSHHLERLYKTIKGCDVNNEEVSIELTEFTSEEAIEATKELDQLVRGGLRQAEMKHEIKKKIKEHLSLIHKSDEEKTFVIEAFKEVYSSVYTHALGMDPPNTDGAEWLYFRKFVSDTLNEVLKIEPDFLDKKQTLLEQ